MKFTDALWGHRPLPDETVADIWNNGVFCFDTNVLLNLYRYSDKSRDEFFDILEKFKDRLFVPATVAHEFARNRVTVIRDQKKPQRDVLKKLEEIAKVLEKEHQRHPLCGQLVAQVKNTKEEVAKSSEEVLKRHEALEDNDYILDRLLNIVGDDVGDELPEAELEKEYSQRKSKNQPPFCAKDDKKENGTGDVAIWLEVLKHCEDAKKPLVLVTNDQKENWWNEIGGRHTPQPALVQEFHERTKLDVLFYASDHFMESARERLKVPVSDTLVEETKVIGEEPIMIEWTAEELAALKTKADTAGHLQYAIFSNPLLTNKFKLQQEMKEHLEKMAKTVPKLPIEFLEAVEQLKRQKIMTDQLLDRLRGIIPPGLEQEP